MTDATGRLELLRSGVLTLILRVFS
jgi:hypothetical protein